MISKKRDIVIHTINRKPYYNNLILYIFDCEFSASEFENPTKPYVFFRVSVLYDPDLKKSIKTETYDEIPAMNEEEFQDYFEIIIRWMNFSFTFEFNEKIYAETYGLDEFRSEAFG